MHQTYVAYYYAWITIHVSLSQLHSTIQDNQKIMENLR